MSNNNIRGDKMEKNKYTPKRIKIGYLVKKLALITMLICILVITTSVHAGNKDSTLVRNVVDGVYAIAPLSDRTHLYNLEMYTINNKTAYCIEIGKKITSTTYNSTTNENEQINISKLTKKQLDYIKLISYFGYNYPGDSTHNAHKSKEYYMATQELIWEYLNNIDITWTNELDINGSKINIDTYKNEIINLMKKYTNSIALANNYDIKIGQVFKMNHDLLSYYKVKDSGHQKASINNNTLEIIANENYIGKDKITIDWNNIYNYKPAIYNFEDSQTLLSVGSLEEQEKTFNLNIYGETLKITLIDKDTKKCLPSGQATLEKAIYGLYDEEDNLIETIITDNTCTNTINNLYHKTYYLKQISPSKGYKPNNETNKFIMNMYRNITLEEEVIKSTIELNKLYEINDNYEREANINFNIYDNKSNLYTTITTTKTGLNQVILPYGTYTIKQENTTYGYEKVPDIKLSIDESSNTTIRYDLLDKKITTKVHITTKDKNTKENIKEENIKYKIKDKTTNKYLTYIDSNNKKISEFSTNKSGELTIPIKLSYGEYQLEQVTSPTKYLENKEKIEIIINDKSTYSYIENEIVINIDFLNIPITGKLNILTTKENIENNNKITEIPKIDNEIELYYEDKLIDTYKTDKLGEITIDNLKLGKYCVIEKDTNKKECIEIINKDNKTEIIEKDIKLIENIHKVDIELRNIDENNKPIKETTFELYKDNNLIDTYITNNNGIININNLPVGSYCFKQTNISSKYILNKEKLCFDIINKSKDQTLIMKNNLNKTKTISIPNTLSNINYKSLLASLLIIPIGVIIHHKKKNHNN